MRKNSRCMLNSLLRSAFFSSGMKYNCKEVDLLILWDSD